MYRFTETNKWNDPWFRKLKASEKLVFLFLVDNCDNAGFYELDIEMMAFQIGIDNDKILGAIEGLNRGLIKSGNYIWIKNFLRHQKNWPLNKENNAHKQILNILKDKSDLFKDDECFRKLVGANKGLVRPIGKGKGKGKVKVEYQEVENYFIENGFSKDLAKKFYNGYDVAGWKDSTGKQIKNWKQKAIHQWFKKSESTKVNTNPFLK